MSAAVRTGSESKSVRTSAFFSSPALSPPLLVESFQIRAEIPFLRRLASALFFYVFSFLSLCGLFQRGKRRPSSPNFFPGSSPGFFREERISYAGRTAPMTPRS